MGYDIHITRKELWWDEHGRRSHHGIRLHRFPLGHLEHTGATWVDVPES